MSDKKKSSSSVYPYFVDGEQPSANKFNSISIQTRSNLYVLEKAIGDIWSENEPYVSSTNVKLSGPTSSRNSFGLQPGSDPMGYSLNIPSLARLIGPISKLNPFNLSEGLANGRNQVDHERDIAEQIPVGVFSYSLNYPGREIISFTGSGAPTALVNSPSLLLNNGDYYYDTARSVVYFYDKSSTDWVVEYISVPEEYAGGSSYTGSTANLIPDEAYMEAQGQGVLVTSSGDYYDVTIPSIGYQNATLRNNTQLLADDINYGVQLKLPNILRELFGGDYFDGYNNVTGEHLIPEGFLYLKNHSTGEIYTDGEYYYISDTQIKVRGIEIDNPSTDVFCIATVGTDITTSIQDLKFKQFHHSHSREFGEPLIPIESIGSITDKEGNSGAFTKSENPSNFAPQYLHRDGYDGVTDTGLNDQNAMRGNLLLGRSSGSPGSYVGLGSSYNLFFGNEDTYIKRGGTMLAIQNEGTIRSTGHDLTLRGDNSFYSSDTDSDVTLERFTNFNFTCQPKEYRASATQRPGGFVFRGGPVYLQGLDSYSDMGGGIGESSLPLGKKRDELLKENSDKESFGVMGYNAWHCPGVAMATIYLNNIVFNQYATTPQTFLEAQLNWGLAPGRPWFLDIRLPKVGGGDSTQFVGDDGTYNPDIDVRVTTNQILTINGLIKNSNSTVYTQFNGAGGGPPDSLNGPCILLKFDQSPDSGNEHIRIVVPSVGSSAFFNDNWGTTGGTGTFDLRITIFYLTHR